jgi:Clostripain family
MTAISTRTQGPKRAYAKNPAKEPSKWLLMVHMLESAPNLQEPLRLDLEELGRPLKEMGKKAAEKVDVVVQVDTATGVSKRFALTSEGPQALALGATHPATTLKEFVESTVQKNEGRRTALVVWGHSSGINHGVQRSVADPRRPGTAGLARAGSVWTQIAELQLSRRLDLVGFDACYMAGAEIAYELREQVHVLLAPQAGIGLQGWHYDLLLDHIVAHEDGAIGAVELGRVVVQQVGLSPSSPQSLSLLNLDHVGEITGPLRHLTEALARAYDEPHREPLMRKWILDSFCEAAWAGVRQFLDLADLCRILASGIPDREIRREALAVIAALSNPNGLIADHLCAFDLPLCGLSLYCPWPRATGRLLDTGIANAQVDEREYVGDPAAADRFPGLAWSMATDWGPFVFEPRRLQEAERRWIRHEAFDQAEARAQDAVVWGRGDEPKPAKRGDEPKPAGRGDEPKPAGRGDEPKPAGRGDEPKPAGRGD